MKKPVERVFVVDDDPAVRKSLWRLLRSRGFEVTTFASAEEFLERLEPDAGGCAVLDVAMPGLDGLALQQRLAERHVPLPIVFLTGRGDIPASVKAMKAGAEDFLTKPVDERVLFEALRRALEGGRKAREAARRLDDARGRLDALTPREREVLDGVVAGRLNKQIAGDLGISEKTVKVHRARVMEKLGAGSVAELVRLADSAKPRGS
ncbi:MAG: response regulator transcription factor [Syntrophomonadaceae bacterium]